MQVNPVALDPLFEKENRERHKAELVSGKRWVDVTGATMTVFKRSITS